MMFRLLIGLNTIQTVFLLLQDMLIAAASVSSILSMPCSADQDGVYLHQTTWIHITIKENTRK